MSAFSDSDNRVIKVHDKTLLDRSVEFNLERSGLPDFEVLAFE